MLFNPETAKILGAQGLGEVGIDKRIDLIANSIKAGFTVYDLQDTEKLTLPSSSCALANVEDAIENTIAKAATFFTNDFIT